MFLSVVHPGAIAQEVRSNETTTQIAPSILKILGLDPNQLKAVQIEKNADTASVVDSNLPGK